MSFDNKYLFFYVQNHTGTYTTSGYTLPCTPFVFTPVLDTGSDDKVSTTRFMWDFGDGTTLQSVTAAHHYALPGTYNVTCYLYAASGQGYESAFTQSIIVKDYISDTLAVKACIAPVIESGHYQSPFTISRFNSWQTYPALSSAGATIMLFASGTNSPIINPDDYAKDKYAHLKPYARFAVEEYNASIDAYEFIPVDRIKTINNSEIYVRLNSSNEIELCDASDLGATLAGTSGNRVVYYVDDAVKATADNSFPRAVLTLAFFDTTDFFDNDSYGKNIPKTQYPVLRQITSNSYTPVIVNQIGLSSLSITSNGVDREGLSGVASQFGIAPSKFVGQKIPFVIKAKDNSGYTIKSIPNLTAVPLTNPLTPFDVKIRLVDIDGNTITNGIVFNQDFATLSGTTIGGVYMGYLSANTTYSDVRICAETLIETNNYYSVPTAYACIPHPQSRLLHVVDIQQPFDEFKLTADDKLVDTITLTGIYTTAVVPSRLSASGCVDYSIWTADADLNIISKHSLDGVTLLSAALPARSSPSEIAVDGEENVWVSLYDAVSTLKINGTTGAVMAAAVPPFTNVDYSESIYYEMLSGYAGGNSITPRSIDVDRSNNLWVSYDFPLSGIICKFNTNGVVSAATTINSNYLPGEIMCRLDGQAWVILKEKSNQALENNDALALLTGVTSLSVTPKYTGHSLWNITHDTAGMVWATADRSKLIKFTSTGEVDSIYTLPATNIDYDVCELGGIACTTSNTIVVLSETYQCLFYFNVEDAVNGTITALNSATIATPSDIDGGTIQDMANAYGDWTGFRYIHKYITASNSGVVSGCSSTFNIYPASGAYSIAKVNENFNPQLQYSSFVFQESLQDYTRLFKDFLGAAVGVGADAPTVLGKKVYEKISNFCDNIAYVDTCNIEALKSLYQEMNESFITLNQNNFNYPANISRLIDIFSIKLSKLRGSRNQFAENFNSRGFDNQSPDAVVKYGRNKGVEINPMTTILRGGVDGYIVAYEKFSETYTLINTNLPVASYVPYIDAPQQLYPMSAYDARWGWGLVLPDVYSPTDISKYYTFYRYKPGVDGDQIAGVINWSDPNTTVPEEVNDTTEWDEVVENMLTHALAEGLEIM